MDPQRDIEFVLVPENVMASQEKPKRVTRKVGLFLKVQKSELKKAVSNETYRSQILKLEKL